MLKNLSHIGLFIILLSCQEASTLDFVDTPPALVIEGKITDQQGPYTVKLHLSSSFDEDIDRNAVENAQVVLSDDLGNEEILSQTEPGIFQTTTIQGTIGVNYTLEVTYNNVTYAASSYLAPVVKIDSLVSSFYEESLIRDEGYYVALYAQKGAENEINYYRWHLFKNDSLLNGREFLYVDSDEFRATLEGLEFGYAFGPGDTVKCEMESLSLEAYNYFIQLNTILNNDGVINKSRNINPPTNFSPKAVGIFQTSAVSTKEVIIVN